MTHYDNDRKDKTACGIKWGFSMNTTTLEKYVTCKRCLVIINKNKINI